MSDKYGSKLFQYLATLTGALAVVTSGINQGWTSPYLPQLMSNTSTIPTTSEQGSWCAVAALVGGPPGSLLACILADKIGRKWTTLVMAPIVFMGFISIAFAKSIWMIVASRFFIATGEGAYFISLPMYIGEISDPDIRGFLSASVSIAVIVGVLFVNVVGAFLDIFSSSILFAAIPVIHFFTYLLMPESPYYYLKKQKVDKARASLKVLRGSKDVEKELEGLCSFVEKQEQTAESSYLDLIRVKSNRKAVYIYIMLAITNKFSGKNPCMFYTTTIFQETGSTIDSKLSVIIFSAVELLSIALTSFLIVDRFGKRPILITSSLGCGIAISFLATHFLLKDFYPELISHLNWLPITALVSYNVLFSIGLSFGTVAVLSELFPTTVKAKALCLADISSVVFGTIASKYFQLTYDYFGNMYVPFYTFALCCFIGFGFILYIMPETKGKSLEEIQDFLIGEKTVKRKTISC